MISWPASQTHAHHALVGDWVEPAPFGSPRPFGKSKVEWHIRKTHALGAAISIRGGTGSNNGTDRDTPTDRNCHVCCSDCHFGRHCYCRDRLRGRQSRRRLNQAGKLHRAKDLNIELSLRVPDNTAQLLSMPSLKGTDEDTTNLKEPVQVLRAGVCTSTQINPVIAHGVVHIKLVNVAHCELNVTRPAQSTALPCVCHGLWPDVNAVVCCLVANQLPNNRVEVACARTHIKKRHARLQRHQ
mmetsp:Transcript_119313/g.210954  ORF Transcript_119313/g.210954 Transcript_119313/m.210954 type:complete len:241 (-) Transcript_119313:429-1151(-)